MTVPIAVLAALAAAGWIAAFAVYFAGRRAPSARSDAPSLAAPNSDDYGLIMNTLDHSNILLWWARVKREGLDYSWKIRTPPQLRENPLFRLAGLADQGGLWKDEQAPDNERTKRVAARALTGGAPSYQQEFRIIGPDGMHWLSEEVLIRPAAPGEWDLAGVVIDVTKRHEAEESRKRTEAQLDQILKGADCLLWQAFVTGDPEDHLDWQLFLTPSVLYRRIFGEESGPGQNKLWSADIEGDQRGVEARDGRGQDALRPGVPRRRQGPLLLRA
jgi:PAS domain-containing protein